MNRFFWYLLFLSLLNTNTAVAITPAAQEFTAGNRIKFSTAGHSKSKGLNMVMSYPSSWKAMEGERPNIVQKFVSDAGRGLEMVMIITKNLPLAPGESLSIDELREILSPAQLKEMLPQGATLIGAKSTSIEGVPAGMLEYRLQQERAGISLSMQFVSYIFFSGATMVQLQCGVTIGQSTSIAALSQRMKEFKPLFFLMANSIVLQDKWK